MFVRSTSIVLFMLSCTCLPDVISAGGKKTQEESHEGSILREYFSKLHLEVDSYNQDWVKLYDKSIIDAMQTQLEDPDFEISIDGTLNKKIFRKELDKITTGNSELSREELAALNAIELILPNEESKPAIEDLKNFVKDQPKLGGELLNRLVISLDDEKLDYETAKQNLNGFYLRWIPLGRLNKFIETNGVIGN